MVLYGHSESVSTARRELPRQLGQGEQVGYVLPVGKEHIRRCSFHVLCRHWMMAGDEPPRDGAGAAEGCGVGEQCAQSCDDGVDQQHPRVRALPLSTAPKLVRPKASTKHGA